MWLVYIRRDRGDIPNPPANKTHTKRTSTKTTALRVPPTGTPVNLAKRQVNGQNFQQVIGAVDY